MRADRREFGVLVVALLAVAAGPSRAAWDPFFDAPAPVADFGAAARAWGIAVGDFDEDGDPDLVVGRVTGHVAWVEGNGDGTFQPPVAYAWKQAYYNAWSMVAADADRDGHLDVVWGANAESPAGAPVVNDGEVRYFRGNGDGTFVENAYLVSGVLHNAGALIADAGADAGSLAAGDVDGDSDADLIVGSLSGTDAVIRVLFHQVGGWVSSTIVQQPTGTSPGSPIYYPAIAPQNSPWGLALGDVDADGDLDLWVGDRALYVYLYLNDGFGSFSLVTPNTAVSGRPNVYLGHDTYRAAVGYTPSLAAGDVSGDGKADAFLGLQSGAQASSAGIAHDGEILLDLSRTSGHAGIGTLFDVGAVARGTAVVDLNGDSYPDIVTGEYDGKVQVLRQLPPLDTDLDGITDYVDNAPYDINPPRLDINTDASVNFRDQLDNDFDTVLGDPGDTSTWVRLGDVADADDDNDGVSDLADNCRFAANPSQADVDADGTGDACDPLDGRDPDADGLPNGRGTDDPLYPAAVAARNRWNGGSTRFVIRIDALSRFFQNEFTQILTDAGTLTPAEWEAKCWENYDPGDIPGDPTYEPCGTEAPTPVLTLPGGTSTPISLVLIPKQIWSDPPVVAWMNDRNDSARLELGLHGTYHANNTPVSDWAGLPDRNWVSCEWCGLTEAENAELLKVGFDTMVGDYANKWVAESGALPSSPRLDWSTSANPLISFAPPFNASDAAARKAFAQMGFVAFSASVYEETWSIMTPEGSHHEALDQFGMFHVSADAQVDPPETSNGTYDVAAFEAYLLSHTTPGGLNTWLIEEVEWSGRPCNDLPRLGTCNGGSNRENNTVYPARWNAWLQLLDFVNDYPESVVLTMGEVGLARSFDNCPDHANPGQDDLDRDGLGDACDLDDDGDGVADSADCAPLDAGVYAIPVEIAWLRLGPAHDGLEWASAAPSGGPASVHDVVRGPLDVLPVGGAGETCLASGSADTALLDGTDPNLGNGFWYLVRGRNVCGSGTYGVDADGTPRVTGSCP
jgi:hypothetical protein